MERPLPPSWPVSVVAAAYPLRSAAARDVGLIAPANPPFPGITNLPFQLRAGIHSSILISESALGISVAVTRQKAGKSANGDGAAPRPLPDGPAAGGGAPAPLNAGNGTKLPASTALANVIVVCGSVNLARLSQEAPAAGRGARPTTISRPVEMSKHFLLMRPHSSAGSMFQGSAFRVRFNVLGSIRRALNLEPCTPEPNLEP